MSDISGESIRLFNQGRERLAALPTMVPISDAKSASPVPQGHGGGRCGEGAMFPSAVHDDTSRSRQSVGHWPAGAGRMPIKAQHDRLLTDGAPGRRISSGGALAPGRTASARSPALTQAKGKSSSLVWIPDVPPHRTSRSAASVIDLRDRRKTRPLALSAAWLSGSQSPMAKVGPELASRLYGNAADIRCYGDSGRPPTARNYSALQARDEVRTCASEHHGPRRRNCRGLAAAGIRPAVDLPSNA